MPSPRLFSIVVPVYNVCSIPEEFSRCLDSIRRQTWREWELILVDDASSDATPDLLRDLARDDGRIRIHRHETNLRQGRARNSGTALAQGEYTLYCDYDDALYPLALEAADEVVRRFGGPDIIQYKHSYFDEGQFDLVRDTAPRPSSLWWKGRYARHDGDEILSRFLFGRVSLTSWSRAIRTELAKSTPFPDALPEDMPHTMELCAKARTMVVTREPYYAHIWRRRSDWRAYGHRNLFRDYIRCYNEDISERFGRLDIPTRLPQAHKAYCIWWMLACTRWLDGFDHSDEDLVAFGKMVDDIPFPSWFLLARFLMRGVGLRKALREKLPLCRLARRHYQDYKRRLC